MRKGFIAALLVFVCSGCAFFYHPTHKAYNRTLSSWVGRGTTDLYHEWGYPQSIQSIADDTFLETYYKDNSFTQIRFSNVYEGSYRPFTDVWETKLSKLKEQPMPKSYNCRTSFIVINGVIMDYSYKGYGCVE